MRDFTVQIYKQLLLAIEEAGYAFLTFEQYCESKRNKSLPERYVILRHDVDKRPWFSVQTAEAEALAGAKASYYFRIGKESNNPECIKRIAALGHEVGYHYEDMSLCHGDYAKAYEHFRESLDYFRQFYPIRTCCMHGAPMSKYDSRALWEIYDTNEQGQRQRRYDYRDLQLIGEPYYDVDFSQVLYLTDTGRCWDGYKYSLRDKVPEQQKRWNDAGWSFHSTDEIIKALQDGKLPAAIMFTTHPQRWTDKRSAWLRELIEQNIKNIIKGVINRD